MSTPIKEHTSRIRASQERLPEPSEVRQREDGMQPVLGGSLRRIVFEGEGFADDLEPEVREVPHSDDLPESEVQEVPRREPLPRRPRRDDIDYIEQEVDRLYRTGSYRARPPIRRDSLTRHSVERTVYRTARGEVTEAYAPSEGGTRRVLYVKDRTTAPGHERRFHSSMVDRIISGVRLESRTAASSKTTTKRAMRTATASKTRTTTRKTTRAKTRRAASKASAAKEADDYQPQCAALTKDGLQCRNSSRAGSEYCGAHRAYKPVSLSQIQKARDTAPRHKDAEDTLPGQTARKTSAKARPQCAAYTKDGMQCRNSARKTSKYCGSHKGYRAPSKRAFLESLDTKPRHAGAKDTLPEVK